MKQYKNLDLFTTSFRPMRNTVSGSPLRAFMKIVVDADTDKVQILFVLGCRDIGRSWGLGSCGERSSIPVCSYA